MIQQNNQYKTKYSGQISRKRRRNAEKNRPRLEKLKELMGCYQCGRSEVPGKNLDAHHVYGQARKHKPLAHHCSATWRKVLDELLGIDREQGRSGGPCVPVCQRFHEDEIKYGDKARPCTHACFKDVAEPYRVKTRMPGCIRSGVEAKGLDDEPFPKHSAQASWWQRLIGKLKNRFSTNNPQQND